MALKEYKREMCKVAKQLYYQFVMPDIYRRINAAKSEMEIGHIMITARHLL